MIEPDSLRETRTSYDAVADDYAEYFRDELARRPLDRALLAVFAELVQAAGGGPVADVGSGTGRATAHRLSARPIWRTSAPCSPVTRRQRISRS